MCRRSSSGLKALSCASAIFLASCGGGGGGYGSGGGGSMGSGYGGGGTPMPTVMFTSPAQAPTIHLGQAVKLTWASSNAASCTASTSSDIGGAFTGSQANNGSLTVAPVGTGTVTYTLSCTGTGGTMSATSPAVTVSPSILSMMSLSSITVIGSTLDPIEHGGNPYGLALATTTAGLVNKGDLIVCNFNDGATNTQGNGTTVVDLGASPGETTKRLAQSSSLEGCNSLAVFADGSISAAAFTASQVPLVAPSGAVSTPFSADTIAGPWGQAYVAATPQNPAALYVSSTDGSVDRITLNGDTQTAFTQILKGLCTTGVAGGIYAPAGLTYDASVDTLYVVDTGSYSVIALANVSQIGAAGVVNATCPGGAAVPFPEPSFSGPSASSATVIAHGAPLFAPLSAALLADGDLIVENSDINPPSGQTLNLAVEVSPVLPGGFVGQPVQLDTSGTGGALFGIVATTDGQGNQILYFNDDNTNDVMMMTQ